MKALARHLIQELRPMRRPARVLYLGAAFWMASALVHLVALGADGWAWSGAVSFRKPLIFSLSIALLMATMGWVLDRLPERPRLAGAIAWTFLVSSTVEVGLITVQACLRKTLLPHIKRGARSSRTRGRSPCPCLGRRRRELHRFHREKWGRRRSCCEGRL